MPSNSFAVIFAMIMILGPMMQLNVCAQEYEDKEPDKTYDVGFSVYDVDMTRDGNFFMISTSQNLSWYRIGENDPIWVSTGPGGGVKISGNGNYVICCREDTVYLYNTTYNLLGLNIPIAQYATAGRITCMDIADDGKFFTIADDLGNIYVFETHEFIIDIVLPKWMYNSSYEITSIAMSGNGKYLTAGTGWKGNRIYFFSLNSNVPLWTHIRERGGTTTYDLGITYNGEYIAAYYPTGVALLTKSSNQIQWYFSTMGSIEKVHITPDGKFISFASSFGDIIMLTPDGKKYRQYETKGFIDSLCISPNGRYVLTQSHQFDFSQTQPSWIYIYFSSPQDKWVYPFNTQRFTSGHVAMSDDAKYILTAYDQVVFLFINENLTHDENTEESQDWIDNNRNSGLIITALVIIITIIITNKRKKQKGD